VRRAVHIGFGCYKIDGPPVVLYLPVCYLIEKILDDIDVIHIEYVAGFELAFGVGFDRKQLGRVSRGAIAMAADHIE
jgi:hypothetical protein